MTKILDLHEAAAYIEDGMTLAFGGMTLYRRPIAFVRALLKRRQRPRDLTLLSFTCGIESDLLVGAGCVKAVRSVYFGLESFGFAPMFTEKANAGTLTVVEETEASIALGLRAHLSGVGFMPSTAWIGTDLPMLRPDVKTILDPYTGETLIAFPAIAPDVTVLHALEGDANGDVKINNNLGIDLELTTAADTTIVTVERIVSRVERSLDGFVIPAPGPTFVAHALRGAYPTSCYPDYPIGGQMLLDYVNACVAGHFDDFLTAFLAD